MLTDEQLEILGEVLAPLFQYLEQEIIADVARRIKKTMTYTRTAELQAMSMRKLGYSPAKIRSMAMKILNADSEYRKAVAKNTLEYKKEVKNIINGITKEAYKVSNEVVANAGNMSWVNDLSVWKQAGKALTDNGYLNQLVDAFAAQTAGELKNLTNTTGFKTMSGYESIQNLYHSELDKAVIKVCSGTFSQDKVLRDAIHDLAQSGLRAIDYKGGYSMQLDTAVRVALRTGCHQLSEKMMDKNIEQTGENLVYVSGHLGARNTGVGVANHEQWQRKVYYIKPGTDYSEEVKRIGQDRIMDCWYSTGYSPDGAHTNNPLGLGGYNCRHKHFAWFLGASSLPVEKPEPKLVVLNGKEYDYYAVTQKMRSMERSIRALKREKDANKQLGIDNTQTDAKISQKTREYKEFCISCDVPAKTTKLRYESGTSDIKKTNAYKDYRNSIEDNEKSGTIELSRDKLISGKCVTSNEQINGILSNELSNVKMSVQPVYNGRVRSQGKTVCELYPWGEPKAIRSIELGKQVRDTRECVIDSVLHEELEARIMMRSKNNKFYKSLYEAPEADRHIYINRVIKRYFNGKGLNYDMV